MERGTVAEVANGDGKNAEEEATSSRESDSSARGVADRGQEQENAAAEGRRCALCGEAKDVPPAAKAASVSPDNTVGGRLLGPLSDRMGVAAVWVHHDCAVWSPEVYFLGVGVLKNVKAALRRGRFLKCSRCAQPGATIGCRVSRCPRTYHLPCARVSGCSFNPQRYLMSCAEHVSLFLRQDKKRLRECIVGLWDDQNAKKGSKDRREDTKLAENAEDEEFLKRERKRLQRDLAGLAPVKLGGGDSNSTTFQGWESVGGLQKVVQCLKEMVTLPLLYPDTFQKIGIVPPRGVLLHGYPGTGKTLVVRALLGACARGQQKIAYFSRKGADCLGKYVGDAERQLRLLFQLAEQSQPSIIFFDELDGLAPKRSRNQDQTLSSVVSTLLALMDGLNPRGSVVVIGATNRPDALDPALRRAGRFDREIFFPLPSAVDREAILKVHTKSWKKQPSPELLSTISKSTVGYAGADLQAVCVEAAMVALRRSVRVQDLLSTVQSGSEDCLPEIHVTASDWISALAHSGPPCARRMIGSALSEIHISPLPYHLVHLLLRPVLLVFLHLDSDGRFFLPPQLKKPLALVKEIVEACGGGTGSWSATVLEDLENACRGTGIFSPDDERLENLDEDDDRSQTVMTPLLNGWRTGSFRILLTGNRKDGKSVVAASVLHILQFSMQVFVLSMQTMIQAGSGDLLEGVIRILESARVVSSVVFMPSMDSWAVVAAEEEESSTVSSQVWSTFLQQTGSFPPDLPVLFLATCEKQQLTPDVMSFFTDPQSTSKAKYSTRTCVEVSLPAESDVKEVFKRAATTFSNALKMRSKAETLDTTPTQGVLPQIPVEPKGSVLLPSQPQVETCSKQRGVLLDAIRCCGHQLLTSPHFASVRQATARLTSGPSLFLDNPYTGAWVIKDVPPTAEAKVSGMEKSVEKRSQSLETGNKDGGAELTKVETEAQKAEAITRRFIDALGPEDDDDADDLNRRIWGVCAVGLKACKGFYGSGLEVARELKIVGELLREKLQRKSNARRSRWHCCKLLTQAAALQDLMDCWVHELIRLESRDKPHTREIRKADDHHSGRIIEDPVSQFVCGSTSSQKQRLGSSQPVLVDHLTVERLLKDVWEKQGRSLLIEDIHELVSESSARLFSELEC